MSREMLGLAVSQHLQFNSLTTRLHNPSLLFIFSCSHGSCTLGWQWIRSYIAISLPDPSTELCLYRVDQYSFEEIYFKVFLNAYHNVHTVNCLSFCVCLYRTLIISPLIWRKEPKGLGLVFEEEGSTKWICMCWG